MHSYKALAIAASLGTLTLAGCGGGSSGTAATPPDVSVADYVVPRVQNCGPNDKPETALQG